MQMSALRTFKSKAIKNKAQTYHIYSFGGRRHHFDHLPVVIRDVSVLLYSCNYAAEMSLHYTPFFTDRLRPVLQVAADGTIEHKRHSGNF